MQGGWGFSHNKGWICGYKLHMISSTGSIIVPLAADFTTANVQDNQMYNPMISSSLSPETWLMIDDSGYDDHKLYDLSTKEDLNWYVQYRGTKISQIID